MPLFDTHVHYNLDPLFADWQAHYTAAKQHGVIKSMVVGAGMRSSLKAIQLAKAAEGLFAAIGKHPDVYREAIKIKLQNNEAWQTVFADLEADIKAFQKLIDENREVVKAIGEVGLDYYKLPQNGDKREWMIEIQKKAFAAYLELAFQNSLPVIVHVRDKIKDEGFSPETDRPLAERNKDGEAYWDALEIISNFKRQHSNFKFVLHCISGPSDYVKQALELGAYIGVDGNITYLEDRGQGLGGRKQLTNEIIELARLVPAERLLLETDAPYLAPEPFIGQICEPWMISKTAEFVEAELKISQEQLFKNAVEFFRVS